MLLYVINNVILVGQFGNGHSWIEGAESCLLYMGKKRAKSFSLLRFWQTQSSERFGGFGRMHESKRGLDLPLFLLVFFLKNSHMQSVCNLFLLVFFLKNSAMSLSTAVVLAGVLFEELCKLTCHFVQSKMIGERAVFAKDKLLIDAKGQNKRNDGHTANCAFVRKSAWANKAIIPSFFTRGA